MKKISILFVLILTLIQYNSFSQKNKALEFNNKISKLSTNYLDKAKEFGRKLQTSISTHNFSTLQKTYNELNKIIADDIIQITALKNVGGSEDMKTTMLAYLKFEQNIIAKGFRPFIKMTKSTTDKEVKTATDNLMELVKKESDYLIEVRKVQQEYADKNGFRIAQ